MEDPDSATATDLASSLMRSLMDKEGQPNGEAAAAGEGQNRGGIVEGSHRRSSGGGANGLSVDNSSSGISSMVHSDQEEEEEVHHKQQEEEVTREKIIMSAIECAIHSRLLNLVFRKRRRRTENTRIWATKTTGQTTGGECVG